jgi:hypothetical protein
MKGLVERQVWYSGCPDNGNTDVGGGREDEERAERSRVLRLQSERQSHKVSEYGSCRNVIVIYDVKVRAESGLHLVKSNHALPLCMAIQPFP